MEVELRRLPASLFALLACATISALPAANAQTTSTWLSSFSTGSWFDVSRWDNGIPNTAGDTARIPAALSRNVTLSQQATVGQVDFFGLGQASINGTGPLVFDRPGSDPALLQTVPSSGAGVVATIGSPISLASGEQLSIVVGQQTSLALNGSITAGSSDITKSGAGPLTIGSGIPAWTGRLFITGGTVDASTATALGTTAGNTTISGGGVLTLRTSSSEPLELNAGTVSTNASTAVILGSTINLTGNGTIQNLSASQGATWNGVISGAGDLRLQNSSSVATTIGGNNSYTGHTYVSGTSFQTTTSTAFGSALEGTTIQSGTVTLNALTDETFVVQTGGTLALGTAAASYVHPVTLDGGKLQLPFASGLATPVVLTAAGGIVQAPTSATSWAGGATGPGNLRLNGHPDVNAPLQHTGSLTMESARLFTANSYQGETIVLGASEVSHAGALGSSPTVRIQNNGSLKLNVLPSTSPNYLVEKGTLTVATSAQPFTSSITLGGGPTGGGSGDAALEGPAVFNGPIHLVPDGVLHQRITSATVNGTISGRGDLVLIGVDLNAANDIYGSVAVPSGVVNVNHLGGLDPAMTFVYDGGRLNLNVPTTGNAITNEGFTSVGTVQFNAPQNYSDSWVVNSGSIEAASQVGMSKLILLGLNQSPSQVRSLAGGTFRLDGEMDVKRWGAIEGLSGTGTINLDGFRLTVADNLQNFTGDFNVHNGTLEFGTLASGFTLPAQLNSQTQLNVYDGGTLEFVTGTSTNTLIISNDIFLHNAHGANGHRGALIRGAGNGTQVLQGRLDVGDQGSSVDGLFQIKGRLTGNNLTIYGGFEVYTPQNDLHGTLAVRGGALSPVDQGQFHGLDQILLENDGALNISSSTFGDRIDDAIPIHSRGGKIYLYSSYQQSGIETLGTVHLDRGFSELMANSDNGTPTATLTIAQLERDQGAILHYHQGWWTSTTRILNPAPLQYGIIGPWAVTDDGFATLDANGGIHTVADTSANLDTAGPTDQVFVQANQSLTTDRMIASLRAGDSSSIDLGGHRLTIASGGIFRGYEIKNGQLTAGTTSQSAELVIHQNRGPVAADIVDNASGGQVALVATGGRTQLSGHNTYTGGTWVVGTGDLTSSSADGQLVVASLSAVPANDRVFVDHGIYNVQNLTSGTVNLAELHLRGGGKVRGGSAALNINQLTLEDGQFAATLMGSGSVVKETDGAVDFSSNTSPSFTGTFTVRGGVVSANANTFPQAHFILEGGELQLPNSSNYANNIVLRGGSLEGRFTGTIDVQTDSQLSHGEGSSFFFGNLTGSGDLTIRGTQTNLFSTYVGLFGSASGYKGDIRIESGALRVGYPSNAGTGQISVMSAGRLVLGANTYSNPATSIGNQIDVYGGMLYSTPPTNTSTGEASPGILSGNVMVHDEAYIGALSTAFKSNVRLPGLTFAGQLTLSDGTHVYGLSDGRSTVATGDVALVDVAGELRVGANTTWHLLTSSLSISGLIRPNGPNSSINFEGIPTLLRMGGAGIQVDAGQRLSILLNGEAADVQLSGSGNTIQGAGLLAGDYTVANGAAVSPGNSPGLLTIDGDMTFGPSGHLAIELAGTALGSQYDSLNVTGNVLLNGASLDVTYLNGFIPSPGDAFVILRGTSISGTFANASSSITVGGITLPVTYLPQMVVLGNAAAVPEPGIIGLLVAMQFFMPLWRRKRS